MQIVMDYITEMGGSTRYLICFALVVIMAILSTFLSNNKGLNAILVLIILVLGVVGILMIFFVPYKEENYQSVKETLVDKYDVEITDTQAKDMLYNLNLGIDDEKSYFTFVHTEEGKTPRVLYYKIKSSNDVVLYQLYDTGLLEYNSKDPKYLQKQYEDKEEPVKSNEKEKVQQEKQTTEKQPVQQNVKPDKNPQESKQPEGTRNPEEFSQPKNIEGEDGYISNEELEEQAKFLIEKELNK